MRGSFSGPITINAIRPITISSVNAMSNMSRRRTKRRPRGRLGWKLRSGSDLVLGPALHFAFDRLAGHLWRRAFGGLVRAAFAHPVLEAAHRAAQVGAHVAQLLGAEDQHHDDQDDQPMPDAERAHIRLLFAP